MTEIIGIRFKEVGKVYYFSPAGKKLQIKDKVSSIAGPPMQL